MKNPQKKYFSYIFACLGLLIESCKQDSQKQQITQIEKPIVYYDSLWNRSQPNRAVYFRKIITKDTIIERSDYTMSDSTLVRKEMYSLDGKRNGNFFDALTQRTLEEHYYNNLPTFRIEYQTGKPNQAKIETVFDEKGQEKFKLFYDEEGVYIGTFYFSSENRGNGTTVQYRFPEMKVAKVEQYDKEQNLILESKYTLDGYVYYKFQRESNTQGREIYLNSEGEKIAELQLIAQKGQRYKPYSGTQLYIDWKTGIILNKTQYIDYQKECEYKYDDKGILRQEDMFIDGRKSSTLYYSNKKKPEQLVYDLNENPYEGVLYDNILLPKSRIGFKKGQLIQKQFYFDGILRQSEDFDEKKNRTQYRIYDSKGKLAYTYVIDIDKNIKENEVEIISYRKNRVIAKASLLNDLITKGRIKFYQGKNLVEYSRKGDVITKDYFDNSGKIIKKIQANADIRSNDPLFDEIHFKIEQLYDPVVELTETK